MAAKRDSMSSEQSASSELQGCKVKLAAASTQLSDVKAKLAAAVVAEQQANGQVIEYKSALANMNMER